MNIFHSVKIINTITDLENYYDNRRYLIILYDALGWSDKSHDKFLSNLRMPLLKRYYNAHHAELESQCAKNAKEGNFDANYELLRSVDRNPDNAFESSDTESIDRVDQSEINSRSADVKQYISNTASSTSRSFFDREKILAFLEKNKSPAYGTHPIEISREQPVITIEIAIGICERIANISIRKKFTVFGILGYMYYEIYDVKTNSDIPIGSFYYKSSTEQWTKPLGGHMTLIRAPLTHQLTHEIIHAIQYSFESFFNIPKEIVEIPALMVENIHNPFSQAYTDKTIALAIADLISNTPEQFDYEYSREIKRHTRVCGSFYWHYANYPNQYYSYALGLILKTTNLDHINIYIRLPLGLVTYIDGQIE